MNFDLSEEQQNIVRNARKFAEKEFPAVGKECDREEKSPIEIWKKASRLGFEGIFIPEEYGGGGMGFLEHGLILEEFSRVDPGVAAFLAAATSGSEVILFFGTEEQKKKLLPPLCKGETITGNALTEPNTGTDISGIKTRAVLDGDEWVINGNKVFVTGGTVAAHINFLCVTDPDAPRVHDRFSIIYVETDRPGFESRKMHDKLGIRASNTAEVTLTDVRVPKGNLIGSRGRGFQQYMKFFDYGRIRICAEAIGLAQGAMELAIKYAKERQQFGAPLASFQAIQFKIAEMETAIEAGRALWHKAAWLADNGKVQSHLVSAAKWFCGKTAVDVADEALQIHGGYGYMGEYDVSRYYRDAKISEIYEGTKEVQKLIIARAMLGKC